jgi:hypothetical protein
MLQLLIRVSSLSICEFHIWYLLSISRPMDNKDDNEHVSIYHNNQFELTYLFKPPRLVTELAYYVLFLLLAPIFVHRVIVKTNKLWCCNEVWLAYLKSKVIRYWGSLMVGGSLY